MVGKSLLSQIFKHINSDCATGFDEVTGFLPSAKEFLLWNQSVQVVGERKDDMAPRHSLFSAISAKSKKKA